MYVPGLEKVKLKLPPGLSVPESNAPLKAVTVCDTLPVLCQVTVVPAGTEIIAGMKAKSTMSTLPLPAMDGMDGMDGIEGMDGIVLPIAGPLPPPDG